MKSVLLAIELMVDVPDDTDIQDITIDLSTIQLQSCTTEVPIAGETTSCEIGYVELLEESVSE
jgi:hypothetical protein